ncbi:MAG: ABC transporter permease [Pseudomonadota bacterium]
MSEAEPSRPRPRVWRSPVWAVLAWHEIRFRYRRSTLGPWWITIATAIFVVFVGTVYARLLQQPVLSMVLYISAGFILWQFFSACLSDASSLFHMNRELLLNTQTTPLMLLLRTFSFNLFILAHNFPIYLVLVAITGGLALSSLAMILPGLLLFLASTFALMTIFAIFGARFMDVPAMVPPVLQVMFLITPIMWRLEFLADFATYQYLNPLHHIIAVARDPMVGSIPTTLTLGIMATSTVILAWFAWSVYAKNHQRLIYWL